MNKDYFHDELDEGVDKAIRLLAECLNINDVDLLTGLYALSSLSLAIIKKLPEKFRESYIIAFKTSLDKE